MTPTVSVKVTSTTTRKQVIVPVTATLGDIFREAGAAIGDDMSVSVAGAHTFQSNQLETTKLEDIKGLDFTKEIALMAIVNSKNA